MNVTNIILDPTGAPITQTVVYTINKYSPEAIVLLFVLTYVFVIVCHELAHYYTLRAYKPNTEITFRHAAGQMPTLMTGIDSDYEGILAKDLMRVYISGPIFGLLALLIVSVAINAWLFLLFIPYLMQCDKDLKLFKKQYDIDKVTAK